MVFHSSLSDSKSPQVSKTLLSILTVLSNAVVWMVSMRLPVSKSSSPFNNPLVTVPKVPITMGIIVTFMFHSFFFNSLGRARYSFILLFTFSQFYSGVCQDSRVHNFASSLFYLLLLLLLFTPWEFFISVLADVLSLEFEWQQVSSSLQDSSHYSGRSQ